MLDELLPAKLRAIAESLIMLLQGANLVHWENIFSGYGLVTCSLTSSFKEILWQKAPAVAVIEQYRQSQQEYETTCPKVLSARFGRVICLALSGFHSKNPAFFKARLSKYNDEYKRWISCIYHTSVMTILGQNKSELILIINHGYSPKKHQKMQAVFYTPSPGFLCKPIAELPCTIRCLTAPYSLHAPAANDPSLMTNHPKSGTNVGVWQ